MTREEALTKARGAAARAGRLADHAEQAAHGNDPNRRTQAAQFAAAGTVWADVAHSYAAIAAATPEPQPAPEPDTADDKPQEA